MTQEQMRGLLRLIRNGGNTQDLVYCAGPLIEISTKDDIKRFFTAYHICTELLRYEKCTGISISVTAQMKKYFPKEGALITHLIDVNAANSWFKRKNKG